MSNESPRGLSNGAYAIALALMVHTAAFVFWMGKLSESVDNLKETMTIVQHTMASKESLDRLVDRVTHNTTRIDAILAARNP